jgi:hypothetical protein
MFSLDCLYNNNFDNNVVRIFFKFKCVAYNNIRDFSVSDNGN